VTLSAYVLAAIFAQRRERNRNPLTQTHAGAERDTNHRMRKRLQLRLGEVKQPLSKIALNGSAAPRFLARRHLNL
jgi:hypothetical protein